MATILVIEDNKNTQLLTAARLRPYYTVICADNGEDGFERLYENPVDMIIADVMMPKMDGYTFLKELRAQGNMIPVLLLTAKQSFEDKREGFSVGTDDYLTKPVNYDELLWHVQALLRRANIAANHKIELRSLTVDASAYSVVLNNEAIVVPKKEFDLLYKLLSYPDRLFTKNQLLDEVWGLNSESSEDTVKTHVNRLRARLKACADFEIVTVKGIGYKASIKKETIT